MIRSVHHLAARIVLVAVAVFAGSCASPKRPDILVLLIDDLRWNALSALGNTILETPHLDRLVHEGVSFDQSFVLVSLCKPSRATVFSGLHARDHQVTGNELGLPGSVPLISETLQFNGYETGYIGKWHLNFHGEPAPGFDEWVSFTAGTPYLDPVMTRNRVSTPTEGHLTDILTDYTLEFLRRPREKPYFLVLSHSAVHAPYVPQERFAGMLGGEQIRFGTNVGHPPEGAPGWVQCYFERSNENYRERIRGYHELLAGVDESVGKILRELEEKGRLDDTLILLVSDNGYYLGERGLTDKRSSYEDSMRVPLLIRYPDWFPAGSRVEDELATNLDIAPTLLQAAGIAVPETMQGISLRDMYRGEKGRDWVPFFYIRPPDAQGLAECTPTQAAIRSRTHKLIDYPEGDWPPELYDLQADPHELNNVYGDEGYVEVRETLRSWMSEAPFPDSLWH